jgi:DNA-binding NtrC family response regulator
MNQDDNGNNMTKVLVVDDDEVVLLALSKTLSNAGYEVIKTSNSIEVARALEADRPDVLITDLIMPDREGIEIIMQTRKSHPGLVVIAMSVEPDYLELAERLGADAVMHKRFDHADWGADLIRMIEDNLKPH